MDKYWENGSGYYDPTAKEVMENETREERTRNRQVHDTVREIKNILKSRDLELVDRMVIRDKNTNKEYR